MKILVCISHVPDTTSKINFVEQDSQFDTNGVQFVINPNDEFGLITNCTPFVSNSESPLVKLIFEVVSGT